MFLAYLRCSTLKQLKEGSIKVQREQIIRYCELHKIKDVKFYADEGVSGAFEKPNLDELMKEINNPNIKGVIIPDITRFGRNTVELLIHIREIRKAGKQFISIKNNIDTTTKEGRLFLTMLAGFSEYEREMIWERMELGRAYAREHGTKSGKPMHRPKKEIDIKQVKELRSMGASIQFIANTMKVARATITSRMKEHNIN